ncbi:MAG TPA: hypothetical protein VM290_06095 [Gaiellaceae bacterium]|nr:hypothetical protein [Gaiellaceae bacterium]
MGEWFTSFEDAWRHFLGREEPLESFHEKLEADPDAVGEGWLLVPPEEVRDAAGAVQERLAQFDFLALTPRHFLHVWLRARHGADVEALAAGPPFTVAYARVNCFHDAVVVEASAPRLDEVDAPPQFLPHMTLAYVRTAADPAPLRDVLVELRDEALGAGEVTELLRVRFPFSRSTVLEPWTVVERRSLRG